MGRMERVGGRATRHGGSTVARVPPLEKGPSPRRSGQGHRGSPCHPPDRGRRAGPEACSTGPSCCLATVTTVVVGQIFAGGTLGCPRLEGASAIRPGVPDHPEPRNSSPCLGPWLARLAEACRRRAPESWVQV